MVHARLLTPRSDPIPWPGSSRSSNPPLPDLPPPEKHDLQTTLQDLLTLWCPNVDCTEAHCLPHGEFQISHNKTRHRLTSLSSSLAASEQYELDPRRPHRSGDPPFRLLPATVSCGPRCGAAGENMVRVSVAEGAAPVRAHRLQPRTRSVGLRKRFAS